tara:strand:- start:13 stop:1122 length:1110 start_codon:yes stop_codon:yes gene_type:complete
MNNDNNNFSLIRNAEINRIGPNWIQPLFYNKYKVNETMKIKNAYEDEKYINEIFTPIWKRDDTWKYKRANLTLNPDYDKQYCLLGIDSLYDKRVKTLYKNNRNDFMLLDNTVTTEIIIKKLEELSYQRMKCYSLLDTTNKELENYFHLICKYTENFEIIKKKNFISRHSIINRFSKGKKSYLEIGVEYGNSFKNIIIENKIGVDPDPKFKDERLIKKTSDDFFKSNNNTFDVVFIDGMHQSDYVLKDLNNSIECLNKNGIIFIDDILPNNEREQNKIPIKHTYENNILKYREPWTGDVWKVIYYLIKNHKQDICFEVFTHENYRGVGKFTFINKIKIPMDKTNEIEKYDYNKNFKDYLNLLKINCNSTL